jgi:hypothetical protein
MVTTVLMSAVLFAVAAIVMTRNFSDYNQVRSDRRFEQAIQVADSGVDHGLYKVGANPSYNTNDPPANDPLLPAEYMGPNVDRAAEKEWVLSNVADNPPVTTPEGQWAIIRPKNADVIYSVGYVPNRANPFKVRVIRAAYDYAPFVPSTAILTDGNLEIGANATITGAGGSAHANGNVIYGGSAKVPDGYVSASGSCTGCDSPTIGNQEDSGGGKPKREVPLINPRENYVMSDYDLCPNGEIRTGPSYIDDATAPNTSGVPCGGTLIAVASANTPWRGWKYKGWDSSFQQKAHQWQFGDPAAFDGVYYIYQGSAQVTSNPGTPTTPWKVTLFAEAISSGEEPGHCPHVGGDIDMAGGGNVRPNSKAQPLHLIAGRDLQMSGTPGNKWEGVYAAHEQFQLTGSVEMNGVILANDYCDTVGSPVSQNIINVGGTATLHYDGGLEVPLGRRIRTTHWNEL